MLHPRAVLPVLVLALAACQAAPGKDHERWWRQKRIAAGDGGCRDCRPQMLVRVEGPGVQALQFANELNSFSGQPRFLLVPAKNYGGRPLLVVQASGRIFESGCRFGPLLSEPLGARVSSDLTRWTSGDTSCAAAA